jgi:hypothetical protein
MFSFSKIFRSIFNFLSSLKLAVVVLLSLAYVLALGTIYESLYGTAIAKEKVYGTGWFTLILVLLGVNVLCAALSRWPWRRHHIGFVITHAGIITILIGSVMTQKLGIDGSIAVAEGETENRITLDDPLIQVAEPDLGLVETWKARFLGKPPRSDKPWEKNLKDGARLVVDQFYPHAQGSIEVKPGSPSTNPALQVVLSGLPMGPGEVSQWLFLKQSEMAQNSVQMGPARLSFVEEAILQNLGTQTSKNEKHKLGIIKLAFNEGKTVEIDVQRALKGEMPIEGTAYRLKLLRYLPDAHVVENKLVSASDQPNNPALEFKILGPEVDEMHVVFAKYPDLEGIHGEKKQTVGVKALFLTPLTATSSSNAELYLAVNPKNEILYRIRKKGVLGEVKKLKVGEEVATGWMTIQFKVADYISDAVASVSYSKVNVPQGKSEGPPPAIHLKIEKEGKTVDTWLQQGDVTQLVLQGNPYLIRYGLRAYPLGFSMKLKKFEIGRYAGTNSPSSFESSVEVSNPKAGENFETKIYMNNPLHYKGFTFYQASYQEGEGGPNVSILSVASDPGTPIKYAGSILMVSGIILMFWFKPLFVKKRLAAKKKEQTSTIGTEQSNAIYTMD